MFYTVPVKQCNFNHITGVKFMLYHHYIGAPVME